MPIVAAVATELPLMAAKIAHEIIVATARPPGQCPTQELTAAKRSSPTPPFSKILAINKKSGTANRINPSSVDKIACGAIRGENPPSIKSASPIPPRANATGTRASNKVKSEARIRTTVILLQALDPLTCLWLNGLPRLTLE